MPHSCPGAALFLFELPNGQRILHTGDFRATSAMAADPAFRNLDVLYLDTTYIDPSYCFPLQSKVVSGIATVLHQKLSIIGKENAPTLLEKWVTRFRSRKPLRTLIVTGSYMIGKEKVAMAIANALQQKIYVKPRKRRILQCLEWTELSQMLTDDPRSTCVHLVSMGEVSMKVGFQYSIDLITERRIYPCTWRSTRMPLRPSSVSAQLVGLSKEAEVVRSKNRCKITSPPYPVLALPTPFRTASTPPLRNWRCLYEP